MSPHQVATSLKSRCDELLDGYLVIGFIADSGATVRIVGGVDRHKNRAALQGAIMEFMAGGGAFGME